MASNINKSNRERTLAMERRLIDFAVRIVKLTNYLKKDYVSQYFGKQLLRSGSAPALLYGEARSAESHKDFRHKVSIALKELRESHVNLQIIHHSEIIESSRLTGLIEENNELISIFVSIVRSMDKKLSDGKN